MTLKIVVLLICMLLCTLTVVAQEPAGAWLNVCDAAGCVLKYITNSILETSTPTAPIPEPTITSDGSKVNFQGTEFARDISGKTAVYRTSTVNDEYKTIARLKDGKIVIVTRNAEGNAINTNEFNQPAPTPATPAAASGSVNQELLTQAENAAEDTDHYFSRKSTQGSELTESERTILTASAASPKNKPVYIDSNGFITKTSTGNTQISPALANILVNKNGIIVAGGKFTKTDDVKHSGILSDTLERTTTTFEPDKTNGKTWSETTTTEIRSCKDCDKEEGTIESITGTTRVSRSVVVGKDKDAHEVPARVSESKNFYNAQGEKTGSVQTNYLNKKDAEDAFRKAGDTRSADEVKNLPASYTAPGDIVVTDANGKTIIKIDPEGNYQSLDHTKTGVVSHDEAEMILASAGIKDTEKVLRELDNRRLKVGLSGSGFLGSNVFSTLGFARSLGFFMRAYDQYKGLTQITTLTWAHGWNREKLAQEFCIGAGIENCLTSSICGQIHEITADNVVAGRNEQGQLTSSAVLNAQRSKPIQISGLSRQQLLDIMGNTTVIKGRRIDLTDSSFDPTSLGNVSIRLYHVEYSVSNGAEDELRFNLEFRRSSPIDYVAPSRKNVSTVEEVEGDIQQFFSTLPSTSYGEAIAKTKWFPVDQVVSKSIHEHEYKYSTNEWDTVCLTFDPGVPAGGATSGRLAHELCVPFREYEGGSQKIEEIIQPSKGASAAKSTPAKSQPEGLGV